MLLQLFAPETTCAQQAGSSGTTSLNRKPNAGKPAETLQKPKACKRPYRQRTAAYPLQLFTDSLNFCFAGDSDLSLRH